MWCQYLLGICGGMSALAEEYKFHFLFRFLNRNMLLCYM